MFEGGRERVVTFPSGTQLLDSCWTVVGPLFCEELNTCGILDNIPVNIRFTGVITLNPGNCDMFYIRRHHLLPTLKKRAIKNPTTLSVFHNDSIIEWISFLKRSCFSMSLRKSLMS